MARRLPVRYEEPVRQLVMEKGRVSGVQMERDGSVRRASHTVVAVPPPSAALLLPEELDPERRFFESIPESAMVMPIFFLSRRLRRDVWCYFTDPALRRVFLFALDGHNKIPGMCPSGKSVLTLWPGEEMTPELMSKPDGEILRGAEEDLEVMIPGISRDIEDAALIRHSYVMASCSVGHHRRVLDFRRRAGALEGVSFVGDVFGIGMEGAMASAADAVRRICGDGAAAG
jgi:protoporphyrinogen oxidase